MVEAEYLPLASLLEMLPLVSQQQRDDDVGVNDA